MNDGFIKPDSVKSKSWVKDWTEASKNKIGYLPEERGLYKKMSVIDSILYFASLKGSITSLPGKGEALLKEPTFYAPKKRIESEAAAWDKLSQLIQLRLFHRSRT